MLFNIPQYSTSLFTSSVSNLASRPYLETITHKFHDNRQSNTKWLDHRAKAILLVCHIWMCDIHSSNVLSNQLRFTNQWIQP